MLRHVQHADSMLTHLKQITFENNVAKKNKKMLCNKIELSITKSSYVFLQIKVVYSRLVYEGKGLSNLSKD